MRTISKTIDGKEEAGLSSYLHLKQCKTLYQSDASSRRALSRHKNYLHREQVTCSEQLMHSCARLRAKQFLHIICFNMFMKQQIQYIYS